MLNERAAMFKHVGECDCGETKLTVSLPKSLEKYTPRKCDCDFCTDRNLSFLSHPDGNLEIESKHPLKIQQQGSNQASFLTCSSCGTTVAVVCQYSGKLKGTINAMLLDEFHKLQEPVVVSPKLLEPKEKLSRWEDVWLNVKVNGNSHI